MRIGILGGTGPEGRGLALRLSQAGYPVTIGSRKPDQAALKAEELRLRLKEEGSSAADISGLGEFRGCRGLRDRFHRDAVRARRRPVGRVVAANSARDRSS